MRVNMVRCAILQTREMRRGRAVFNRIFTLLNVAFPYRPRGGGRIGGQLPGGINWTGAIRWPTWFATQALAYGVGFWLVWKVNIGPLFEHSKDAEAWTNIVLLLLVPFIASSRKRSIGSTKFWKGVWIAAIMAVCYYNSVGGVSEGKDTHIEQRQATQTTIGDWETTLQKLDEAKKKIPEHQIVTKAKYDNAVKKRDDAVKTRERECAVDFINASPNRYKAQKACEKDRDDATTAQAELDPIATDWGYEEALEKIRLACRARRGREDEARPKANVARSSRTENIGYPDLGFHLGKVDICIHPATPCRSCGPVLCHGLASGGEGDERMAGRDVG